MINIQRLIFNLKEKYPPSLLEYSAGQLKAMSDTARKGRAADITIKYTGLDQSDDGHARTTWKVPSQSDRDNIGKDGDNNYTCIVEVKMRRKGGIGGLFGLAQGKWGKNAARFAIDTLTDSDVRVHCSCPDFYYSGAKFNLGPSGKYKGSLAINQVTGYQKERKTTSLAPNVRDPNREHVLCKHLIAVTNRFANNAMKIMSDARKFDVKIEVKPERTRQAEKGTPELEKDKKLMEVSDELKKSIVEPLIHAADELEKNQENEGAGEIITAESEPVEKETPDEVGDIISEENIKKEEAETLKPEDKTGEIIDEQNEIAKEETPTETKPEVPSEEVIEQFPEQTEEIIKDENIEQNPKKKLEKDKSSEESKVPADPNEILGR